MKLYYTDVLKAAMMARDHDVSVRIYYANGTNGFSNSWEAILENWHYGDPKFAPHQGEVWEDSYHIFEPVEGDTMKGRTLMGFGKHIILRNNTAFFKPEENDNEQ